MRVPRAMVRLLAVALLCLGASSPATAEPGPDIVVDIPLRPLGDSPIAELVAYACVATVSCTDEGCAVQTSQRYQLALPPDAAATSLRVGLPSQALDRPTSPAGIFLRDEGGNELPVAARDAEWHAVWEVPIEGGGRRALELSYSHPATTDPLIVWGWEAAALSAWGTVGAVHGEFVLPTPADDAALLRVAPHRANLLGERLWWDYEASSEYPPHHVVVVSPPSWKRLQELRARGAHRAVAALLTDLQAAADAEGIPGVDYSSEVIAELLAALEDDPTDIDARADLAAAYRARAEGAPERRLNYLLLAARELAVAYEQARGTGGRDAEELATALGRTYLRAADAASDAGDPAGALEYLGLAREVAGPRLSEELAGADELTLRWAIKLAEQGRVGEALAELDGLLTPALRDNLLRYAPPLVAARTEVSLRPSGRVVRYALEPYPSAAPRVRERLDDLLRRLREVSCCQATLAEEGDTLSLTVTAPARGDALEACRGDIQSALATDQELVTAIVALPWRAVPTAFGCEADLWRDRLRYAESVDTTALEELWRAESEYAGWRLVELYSASPADARAQLEQQLALTVMRQQRRTWEALPSASRWAYRVAFDESAPPDAEWLVAWGQRRELALDRSIPRWNDIRGAALAVAALLFAPLLVRRLWRRLRHASRSQSLR